MPLINSHHATKCDLAFSTAFLHRPFKLKSKFLERKSFGLFIRNTGRMMCFTFFQSLPVTSIKDGHFIFLFTRLSS